VIAYLVVIFAGSSMPGPRDIPGGLSDKTAHFLEYAVLGLLLARALAGRRWLSIPLRYVVAAVVIAAAYAFSDEFHQLFVPGRVFDLHDMAADTLGASVAAGALWACGIIRRSSAERRNQDGT
jgi:VanZ family protein